MLKRIIMLIVILLTAVCIGYSLGYNDGNHVNSRITLNDYDTIDRICRKATTNADGYESPDFTMSSCKVQIFKATGKL